MATPGNVYDDLDSPAAMRADCRAAGDRLRLQRAAHLASQPAPSLHFDEQPAERPKRDVRISEAAARLAGALHFHLE